MQYKYLKEMNIKDWDGQPFRAITADDDKAEVYDIDVRRLNGIGNCNLIVGYLNGHWHAESGVHWSHVYPIEWNKIPKKLMTNRQLAMWLAKGNGQIKYTSGEIYTFHSYPEKIHPSNEEVPDDIKVRKWDSEEWIEPTTDLLEDCL